MKELELIGRKIKGFKFKSDKIYYDKDMCYYIGKVGTIKRYSSVNNYYSILFEDGLLFAYPADLVENNLIELEPTPEYYNNENGSIYSLQFTRNWNSYVFDVVKRLERAEHKGEFLSDIDKCIKTLELYKQEQGHRFEGQFEILNKNE